MSNQFLKLRRSAIPGKVPTTSSIEFGEIAINTYDGLAFIKKSGSLGEEIVVIGSTSGSFTGSFSGTASWAQNAVTASYAPAYLPLTGGTLNGNLVVNGTASISYLNVSYESASIIFSSGSNVFGDAPNDFQTLYGNVSIPTGSFSVSGSSAFTGSVIVTSGITGSLFGTSSWAQNVQASGVVGLNLSQISSGSVSASVNINSASFQITSGSSTLLFVSKSGNVGIGTSSPAYLLDISGSARIVNNLNLGTTSTTGVTITTNRSAAASNDVLSTFDFQRNSVSFGYIQSELIGSLLNYVFYINGQDRLRLSSSTALFGKSNGTSDVQVSIWASSNHLTLGAATSGVANIDTIYSAVYGEIAKIRAIKGANATPSGQLAFFTHNGTSSNEVARIFSNGNTAIGTTNDAGYKFYVSGSSVSGSLNVDNILYVSGSNVGIATTASVAYNLDISGSARVGGNTVIPTWLGVGGVTAQSATGERLNIQGAGVISGTVPASNFLLYTLSGNNRFLLGSEASIGGANNNYVNYVYGNNSFITYTNNVARLTVTGGGNVLMGTTTDTGHKLYVSGSGTSGSLNVNNVLYVSGSSVQVTGSALITGSLGINSSVPASTNLISYTNTTGPTAIHGRFENVNQSGRTQFIVTSGVYPENFFSLMTHGTTVSENYYPTTRGATSDAGKGILLLQGTSVNEFIVGTYNSQNIGFFTNNTVRETIFAGGNIAIGTTTDAGYKLLVSGSGASGSLNIDNRLVISGSSVQITGSLTSTGVVTGTGTNQYTGIAATSAGATATLGYGGVGSSGGTTFDILQNGTAAIGIAQGRNVAIGGGGNTANDVAMLYVTGTPQFSAATTKRGVYFNNTLTATANNDTLVGLDINPTFNTGSFTGLNYNGIRVSQGTLSGNNGAQIRITPTDANGGVIGSQGGGWNAFGIWGSTRWTATSTPDFRIFGNGLVNVTTKLVINTTTDAGFLLDVNGTARVQGNLTLGTGPLVLSNENNTAGRLLISRGNTNDITLRIITQGSGEVQIFGTQYGNLSANESITFQRNGGGFSIGSQTVPTQLFELERVYSGATSETVSSLLLKSQITKSGGTSTINLINVQPIFNTTGGTQTIRGLYHNPTLTSTTGTTHRAIETVSGDVLLGTTSGRVGIGTTTDTGHLLLVSGSGTAGSLNVDNTLYVSGSVVQIKSASIDYQQNLSLATGSWQNIVASPTGSYKAAFFDYVLFSGSIGRAGTVTTFWSASATEFYENFTDDLGGSTAGVALQTAISSSQIVLQATASSAAWTVRSLVRLL